MNVLDFGSFWILEFYTPTIVLEHSRVKVVATSNNRKRIIKELNE
jgi:hypothetical protein